MHAKEISVMRKALFVLPALFASSVQAATPIELMKGYSAEASHQQAGFVPSAQRGADFFARRFGVSAKMPTCTSCHGEDPSKGGRHVVTDKPIKPLAPSANSERFTDLAKAEKWFRRNCKEVVGRDCAAAEKADFIAFLTGGR
jgi:cytochrome c553